MLNPPLCGNPLSGGAEILDGVEVIEPMPDEVSIGVVGFESVALEIIAGVGRTIGITGGFVRGGLLAANSVRVCVGCCVRTGLRTGGFLTLAELATLCPADGSGCVRGCFGSTRRLRFVPRRVGDETLF